MTKPSIVFCSASEAIYDIRVLASLVTEDDWALAELWMDMCKPGLSILHSLKSASDRCQFCVILFTPEDRTTSREREFAAPRDNLVFELGYFMSALEAERVVVVAPRGISLKIPSDYSGFLVAEYDPREGRPRQYFRGCATRIREGFEQEWAREAKGCDTDVSPPKSRVSTASQRRMAIFEHLLRPMFDDLLLIHLSYMEVLQEVDEILKRQSRIHSKAKELEGKVKDGAISPQRAKSDYAMYQEQIAQYRRPLAGTLECVRAKRIEMEPKRVRLMALAREFRDDEHSQAELSFTQSVLSYLPSKLSPDIDSTISESSILIDASLYETTFTVVSNLLDIVLSARDEDKGDPYEILYELTDTVSKRIQNHRQGWALASEQYAKLLLATHA